MLERALILLVAGTMSMPAVTASAQGAGDRDRGREISERLCASCHNTAESGKSSALDPAPPFSSIAELTSTTAISLHVVLQAPHQRMPSNALAFSEVNDIVAYILSLRR